MKFAFGLPSFVDTSERDPYRKTYELAVLAEELGYDMGYVGHHSFTPETGDPAAPFVLLGAIAARTERLRLGTTIYLLPLHHPVSVAEQVAVLDQLSQGRAVLGVGIGYREYEFRGFGIDYHKRGARMTESLEIIRKGWTTGNYAYEGKQFQIPDLKVDPMPVQKPHIPIWVGAVARAAQRRAARLGDAWISDLMQTLPTEKRLAQRYREFCAEEDREPVVCLMRNAWVAPTQKAVEEDWLESTLSFYRSYWKAGARGRDDEGIFQRLERGERVGHEEIARDRAIAGTPEFCIEEIKRWREATGCDYLCLAFTGRRDYESLRRTLQLFAKEVMPEFRE